MHRKKEIPSQNTIGSKEWLKLPIDDRQKKEENFLLSEEEQVQASYQDVLPTCPLGYIYRRNELDKIHNNLIKATHSLLLSQLIVYIQVIREKIKQISDIKEATKQDLLLINFFSTTFDKHSPGYHIVGFFDSTSQDENENIAELRKALNLKGQILDLFFEFDEITGRLKAEIPLSAEKAYDTLYDSGQGQLAILVNNTTQALAGSLFFKFEAENIIDLRRKLLDGRVYSPPMANHNWKNNLSWLLAHIHTGHEIIIRSEITQELLTRTTKGHEEDLTGFAREITLLVKLGYRFRKEGEAVYRVKPSGTKDYKNLSIKEVTMTDEEVKNIYSLLLRKLKEKSILTEQKDPPLYVKRRISSTMFKPKTTNKDKKYRVGQVDDSKEQDKNRNAVDEGNLEDKENIPFSFNSN